MNNFKSRITINPKFDRIVDLSVGAKVHSHFLIQKVECKETSDKRSHYLDLVLMDATGTITAKWWGVTATQVAPFEKSKVVYVTGNVKEYNRQLQLTIDYMSLADDQHPLEYVQRVPEHPKYLWLDIMTKIDELDHDVLRRLLTHVMQTNRDKWMSYPAAVSMHHQMCGGLLYHTVSMLRLAERILEVYPWLKKELLYAGIILHDAGKMKELEVENGIASGRTVHGRLIGHVVEGALWVERLFVELAIVDDELKMILQHLILSHHEKLEWGSPVAPQLPEAFMLCMIDHMDARMFAIYEAMQKGTGTFTEPVKMLSNQTLYRLDASPKERP